MSDYPSNVKSVSDEEAIRHFKESLMSGNHWYIALLESIGLWSSAEEIYHEQNYRYLIAGEAFDWLLLADRLCSEAMDMIPEEELINLLFFAIPPFEMPNDDFIRLIGETKYRAYLNYFYGVIVEAVLILAVEEEIYKEQRSFPLYLEDTIQEEAYKRIYDTNISTLLQCFRNERNYRSNKSIDLTEQKEFTYWLFKYRLEHCEKARVASDTRKALQYLRDLWAFRTGKKSNKIPQREHS